jgi:hypothetical protein
MVTVCYGECAKVSGGFRFSALLPWVTGTLKEKEVAKGCILRNLQGGGNQAMVFRG